MSVVEILDRSANQNSLMVTDGEESSTAELPWDPSMMTEMMKSNLTTVLPMILIGGWINLAFSDFLTTKVLFPLTLRFKPMLQWGIELVSLDAYWVSSASWYFLNIFGLRRMYTLILGQDNAADQSRIMQDQMTSTTWRGQRIVLDQLLVIQALCRLSLLLEVSCMSPPAAHF
ncbi:ER membrane protein complex subunit 3-like [Eleutherodactylus coqui]|uniref:ER membrane protein complex subunit 3-like n=1 Tax=Eleutherodactylus coqui TaxID=57060 RepID=UPI0034621B9C